jgi:hypothetical protein
MGRKSGRFSARAGLTVLTVWSAGCSFISLDPLDRGRCTGICDAAIVDASVDASAMVEASPDVPQMVVEESPDEVDSETDAGGVDSAVCAAGDLMCNGGTPQECVDGGWQNQTPCTGATPVCSNGVCGTYRTTGGIRSTGALPLPGDAGIRLVAGGFEIGTRTCNPAGLCVTGGIVP